MTTQVTGPPHCRPRVGLVSLRKMENHTWRFCNFEFEDVILEIDDAELLMPEPWEPKNSVAWVIDGVSRRLGIQALNHYSRPMRLEKDYELLFVNCMFLSDLRPLLSCPNWRGRSQKAICCVLEVWESRLKDNQPYLEILSRFDHVFLNTHNSVEPIQKLIGKPVSYLFHGIDTVRFSPAPHPPNRCIDLYNMGRRSPVTHAAALEFCRNEGKFYLFDTIDNGRSQNIQQHRYLLSELIKRSRYFIANRAKPDQAELTGKHREIGIRFVEGTAAGAVILGDFPDSELFRQHFDWPGAALRIPYDARDIGAILTALDEDPERLDKIRTGNVVNNLHRNDVAYRWEQVLDSVGMAPKEKLHARIRYLHHLAEIYKEVAGQN